MNNEHLTSLGVEDHKEGQRIGNMAIEARQFDAAEYLDDEESQGYLLNDAIESGDAGYIAHALGTIARAKGGLSHLERLTGIKRQTLNRSLGKSGNPTLETLLPVLKAHGLRLRIEPAHEERNVRFKWKATFPSTRPTECFR